MEDEYRLLMELVKEENSWQFDAEKLSDDTLATLNGIFDSDKIIPLDVKRKVATELGWRISDEELNTFF